MTSEDCERMHGTCIALDGKAAILRGPSGAGKSDLALRFIHTPVLTATADQMYCRLKRQLVTDDQVLLSREHTKIIAKPPKTIAGVMEIRGVGLVSIPYSSSAELCAVVDLVNSHEVQRLPEQNDKAVFFSSLERPVYKIFPFEASAVIKLYYILKAYL